MKKEKDNLNMSNFGNSGGGDPHSDGDRNTKKVCFKDNLDEEGTSMAVDLDPRSKISWKDKLLGGAPVVSDLDSFGPSLDLGNEVELLDGDVDTFVIDGVSNIAFSNCIREILFKDMESTVVLKLLGRNIGYNALYNRILNLWRPSKPYHLMDIANGYFFVKFQVMDDYNKALTQDPWTIYGQYLTVQSWTKEFNPMQAFPSSVMAWIRLPNLLRYLYKKQIFRLLGG